MNKYDFVIRTQSEYAIASFLTDNVENIKHFDMIGETDIVSACIKHALRISHSTLKADDLMRWIQSLLDFDAYEDINEHADDVEKIANLFIRQYNCWIGWM